MQKCFFLHFKQSDLSIYTIKWSEIFPTHCLNCHYIFVKLKFKKELYFYIWTKYKKWQFWIFCLPKHPPFFKAFKVAKVDWSPHSPYSLPLGKTLEFFNFPPMIKFENFEFTIGTRDPILGRRGEEIQNQCITK